MGADMCKLDVVTAIGKIFRAIMKELRNMQKGSLGIVLYFDYVSSEYEPSHRTVEVMDITKDVDNGKTYLEAICLSRWDRRCFRLDRIEQFYDDEDNKLDYKTMVGQLEKLCHKIESSSNF
jgi:hypothetical protein